MAKKLPAAVSEYMAAIGRRGGKVTGRKGTAAMTPAKRLAIAMAGVAARAANKKNSRETRK